MANCSTGVRTAGSVIASSFCVSQRSNQANGSSRAAKIPSCSSRLRRWSISRVYRRRQGPDGSAGCRRRRIRSTGLDRASVQVRILAGRSTRHSASTMGAMASGLRAVDHQSGQILAKRATGTSSATVKSSSAPQPRQVKSPEIPAHARQIGLSSPSGSRPGSTPS